MSNKISIIILISMVIGFVCFEAYKTANYEVIVEECVAEGGGHECFFF